MKIINRNRQEKGITLVALVITIVILLILAGVSIATLTGENGLLTRANEAKEVNQETIAKERVQVEVLGSYGKNGKIDFEQLNKNLKENIPGLKFGENEISETNKITELPAVVNVDGYDIEINGNGDVEIIPVVSKIEILDENGNEVEANSQSQGTSLYIKIEATIKGGTIKTITPQVPYEVTANGIYEFTITWTVRGKDYTRTYKVTVDKYKVREGIKVGDYINYIPDSASPYTLLTSSNTGVDNNSTSIEQQELKWQILRIYDDGSMDLIGSPTSESLTLKGAVGYGNGVFFMNDICRKLYSKESEGIIARSVNYEDVEFWLTPTGKEERERYRSPGNISYGNTNTYLKANNYYPELYEREIGSGINTTVVKEEGIKHYESGYTEPQLDEFRQAKDGLTVTQNGWTGKLNSDNFGEGYNALKTTNIYWIASRYSACYSNYVSFGFWLMYSTGINGNRMCTSVPTEGGTYFSNCKLRPVVSLGSNVKVNISNTATDSNTPHIITQY